MAYVDEVKNEQKINELLNDLRAVPQRSVQQQIKKSKLKESRSVRANKAETNLLPYTKGQNNPQPIKNKRIFESGNMQREAPSGRNVNN